MSEQMIASSLEKSREGTMIDQDQWGAIASLKAQGFKKKAIARMLGLHVQTVRKHLERGGWKPYEREKRKPTLLEGHKAYVKELSAVTEK